ncbi:hypothetical protein ACKVMT_14795 [Halobacteriales archaeon Cl-PHB]
MVRRPLQFTPFHLAGILFLFAGLVLATYHGLAQFDLVPSLSWVSWSHIHFVTIGGFTQLLFGMLPQLSALKLDRQLPTRRYVLPSFLGLNVGFLLLWYGRGWNHTWAFDAGLVLVWLLVLGLLVTLLRQAFRSERAWNPTTGLYLVSVFVFLWGITYAWGLYGHVWDVPGGWLGLREAHVHANAWGFLGLAAIGTLYDVFPRVLGVDLYSQRLANRSAWFLAAGIFPLITGPWLGLGRSVTASGLVLFAIGFAMYLYNLLRTYRSASDRSGLATMLLSAQFWLLGPAGFAPFVLFGVEWVDPAFIEDGALHFFFVGWALPIALVGSILFFRNLPCMKAGKVGLAERADPTDLLPDGSVPTVVSRWMVWVWNLAVLAVGIGFFYQTDAWAVYLFGPGYTVLVALWGYYLVRALHLRRSLRGSRDEAGVETV